jgi:pimeloyl-[acyl-carrier protein] methyl ester esterase
LNGDGWQHGLRSGTHLYDVDIDLTKMRDDWHAFTQAYVPKVFADGKAAERHELIDKMIDFVGDNDVNSMTNLWTTLVQADYVDLVTQLDLPTLVTYGLLSQVYEEDAAVWMEQNLPRARRIAFEDSGHAPHLEESELFNESLAGFVDELESTRNDIN